jgi:hypothetical protein
MQSINQETRTSRSSGLISFGTIGSITGQAGQQITYGTIKSALERVLRTRNSSNVNILIAAQAILTKASNFLATPVPILAMRTQRHFFAQSGSANSQVGVTTLRSIFMFNALLKFSGGSIPLLELLPSLIDEILVQTNGSSKVHNFMIGN